MLSKYILSITSLLILLLVVQTTWAQDYTVNNAGDAPDNNPGDGVCLTALGFCTLRAALDEANADIYINNLIDFSLASGTQITIGQELLVNDIGMTIDADFGGDGKPDIIIVSGIANINGFFITGAFNLIRGFNLVNFLGTGTNAPILISGTGNNGNTIISNFIGTNLQGNDFGSGFSNFRSIRIINGARNNTIGNGTITGRNIISGNTFGIEINSSDDNTVAGNVIGLDALGGADYGNTGIGIEIIGSSNTSIGSAGNGRNFISGNGGAGIDLNNSPNTTVINNYIGTNILGSVDIGNGEEGVLIQGVSTGTTIGNGVAGGGNVISGNTKEGVKVFSDNVNILGNIIGLRSNGTTAIPNSSHGIWVTDGTTGVNIGNGTTDGRNVISGNGAHGILLIDGSNIVQGNYIGLRASGFSATGNTGTGISFEGGANSLIGGVNAGEGNFISGNSIGIEVSGSDLFIYGNTIGLNSAKTNIIPNNEGIRLTGDAQNVFIGDGSIAGANFISGNTTDGIIIDGVFVNNNTIQNNYIGFEGDLITPAGNGANGIIISGDANSNIINNNQIGNNGSNGIELDGSLAPATLNNSFSQNSIFNNAAKAISIINGAQNGLTAPVVTNIALDGTISGTSASGATIEIYFDAVEEGEYYFATTTAVGTNWSFSGNLANFPVGLFNITANQLSGGNTSELSNIFTIPYTPFEVVNTNDAGAGSLRWAIENSNFIPGLDNLLFNIPITDPNYASGIREVWTISPITDLPKITEAVVLDATTQPGSGNFNIVLDGQGTRTSGIDFESPGIEIYGMYISGFTRGIDLTYSGTTGCIIGAVGKGNTLVNNGSGANGTTADGHIFQANYIGTDENGTMGIGNGSGIFFASVSTDNIVGGSNPGEGNVISGNSGNGISTNLAHRTIIEGNFIGTDPTGMTAIPNGTGVYLGLSLNVQVLNNVISSNTLYGVHLIATADDILYGNYIGVAADGTTPLGNGIGVTYSGNSDNHTIGGIGPGEPNIIAYSTTYGIQFAGSNVDNNTFIGNQIFCNTNLGILLNGNGNNGKPAPEIVTYATGSVSGTGIDGDIVHVYRDNTACAPLQGNEYLGTTTVAGGVWTVAEGTILPTDLLNATATNGVDGTSEFAINFGEILVFQGPDNNGTQIFDGQVGVVDIGVSGQAINLDQVFTIENKSSAILTITSVTVTGPDFSIIGAPLSVGPNSTQNFTLRLDATTIGTFNETLTIISDDVDESIFDFPVTGEIIFAGGLEACDYNALVALYNATDGANWTNNTNWLTATPVSTWYGISIIGNRVNNIVLEFNNLVGTLPVELSCLTALYELDLEGNQISGSIPPEYEQLQGLYELDLDANLLTGVIPVELGNITGLTDITLQYNQLTGTIPVELTNLLGMQSLRLTNNQLSGTIPTGFGNLTNLILFELGQNQLTGSIPKELGNLVNLTYLSLSRNQLTGSIPVELGNLVNLIYLEIHVNMLSGPIPAELGNLTNLLQFQLDRNQLTGIIPPELGNLVNLTNFEIYNNQLTGTIPPELGNFTNVLQFEVEQNQLTGPIPSELGNFVNATRFDLSNNQLSGTIPVELGNLISLTDRLELSRNQLTGTIPLELGNITSLTNLQLYDNLLTGSVPNSLSNLTLLTNLEIHDNQLVDLPDLSSLPAVTTFTVYNNNLEFDHIEANLSTTGFAYSPQGLISGPGPLNLAEGGTLDITIPVGGSANQYQWVKDGVDITGQTSDNLIINNLVPLDAGTYSLRITSSIVTGLTLNSEDFILSISTAGSIPEINVYEGSDNTGTLITDGQSTAIDFGTAKQGTSINKIITVENVGTVDLILSSIVLTGADFSILPGAPTNISPGVFETFTIQLSGSSLGTFSDNLTISNNDADEGSFSFSITGEITKLNSDVFDSDGTGGTIIVNGQASPVDLGQTPQFLDLDKTFSIQNTETVVLNITSITPDNPVFEVINTPTSVQPATFEIFVVRLIATDIGQFTTQVTIVSDFGDLIFPVSGEVLPINQDLVVFNAVSPNGDGKHDFLEIQNIGGFPDNQVKIMNRLGEIVYEASGYDNLNIKFDGFRIGGGDLPSGTYYYLIALGDGSEDINGFFSLRR